MEGLPAWEVDLLYSRLLADLAGTAEQTADDVDVDIDAAAEHAAAFSDLPAFLRDRQDTD